MEYILPHYGGRGQSFVYELLFDRASEQLLGHEKLETAQIYTEVSIKHLMEVHERTHPARLRD